MSPLKINAKSEILNFLPKNKIIIESDLMINDLNRKKSLQDVIELLKTIQVTEDELTQNFHDFLNLMKNEWD